MSCRSIMSPVCGDSDIISPVEDSTISRLPPSTGPAQKIGPDLSFSSRKRGSGRSQRTFPSSRFRQTASLSLASTKI